MFSSNLSLSVKACSGPNLMTSAAILRKLISLLLTALWGDTGIINRLTFSPMVVASKPPTKYKSFLGINEATTATTSTEFGWVAITRVVLLPNTLLVASLIFTLRLIPTSFSISRVTSCNPLSSTSRSKRLNKPPTNGSRL